MRNRIEAPDQAEKSSEPAEVNSLASLVGMGALGDFRAAIAAFSGESRASNPGTPVSDYNGHGYEVQQPNGGRSRRYQPGGFVTWDGENRLMQMIDRAGNSFQFTYDGNNTTPSRIRGSNGVDVTPDAQTQITVNHEIGLIDIVREDGCGSTYQLNGTSIEHVDGIKGRFTRRRSFNAADGSLHTSVQREGEDSILQTIDRRDGSRTVTQFFPNGVNGNGQPEVVGVSSRFAPGQANPTYTTLDANGQVVRNTIRNVRDISYSEGSFPGASNLFITTYDGQSYGVINVQADGSASFIKSYKLKN